MSEFIDTPTPSGILSQYGRYNAVAAPGGPFRALAWSALFSLLRPRAGTQCQFQGPRGGRDTRGVNRPRRLRGQKVLIAISAGAASSASISGSRRLSVIDVPAMSSDVQ
jgi:hypothetical protein